MCDERERRQLHAHIMELRIKQLLAHVTNQMAAHAIGWQCVSQMQKSGMLRGPEARPPLHTLFIMIVAAPSVDCDICDSSAV